MCPDEASQPADRRPVLMAVDEDKEACARLSEELHRRYSSDYRVFCQNSSTKALETLEELRANGEEVAIVLCAQWMDGLTGEELLCRVKEKLYPNAKRGLLIEFGAWGDPKTAEVIFRAMARGEMDYYVLKPWRSPDEFFHRTISEFLHEWSRTGATGPREIVLVSERWSPRSHELRTLLGRNGVPHVFHPRDSEEGKELLSRHGLESCAKPVIIRWDGSTIVDPSNTELANAYGVRTELDPGEREFDVVVLGAGPAGLSAAVYASSEGLKTLVVEGESIGGQAGSSSLIRNYLGFSRGVSGAELAQRAYQQAWVFGTRFLLMQRVEALRSEDLRHIVTVSDGSEASARVVIMATGVSYRRLGIPSLEALTGAGVFYGASAAEAQGFSGQKVFVVGGGNSAGQAAMHLARYAKQVTILVRSESLAESMSQYLIEEIDAAHNIEVLYSVEVVDGSGEGRLQRIVLRHRDSGETEEMDAAGLFVLIGARPHTDWLPDTIQHDAWGFLLTGPDVDLEGWPLERPPLMFETSLPGVFAVGDVRHRSVKRVASAVGEGSVVIPHVHQYLAGLQASGGQATASIRDTHPVKPGR